MPKKQPDFLANVLAKVQDRRPGFLPWYQKLPDDLQAELEQVRTAFRAGEITCQKAALCRAIADTVAERGHDRPGQQAVIEWLNRR